MAPRPFLRPAVISIHALREEGDQDHHAKHHRLDDFYPRPPRGGRPFPHGTKLTASQISIHALREEGDSPWLQGQTRFRGFLSTPSARRATWFSEGDGCESENFYPRPPRGGRLNMVNSIIICKRFLSTPSARRATKQDGSELVRDRFLSTPSARRATKYSAKEREGMAISIHALREEGDGCPAGRPRR